MLNPRTTERLRGGEIERAQRGESMPVTKAGRLAPCEGAVDRSREVERLKVMHLGDVVYRGEI